MSKAIKCPSVGTFLAGMKKIQYFIADKKNLRLLCDDNETVVNEINDISAEFLLLDSDENIDKVLKAPHRYVLKPQREGGGNNYYDDDIVEILTHIKQNTSNNNNGNKQIKQEENEKLYSRERYIVMERLMPAIVNNYCVSFQSEHQLQTTGQTITQSLMNNEIGVFGVLIG
jgi:glutathione synthase